MTATTLGRTGFKIFSVGFGGYRAGDQDPVHREALRLALTTPTDGRHLVDTSTNYMNGGSERLVGEALAELQTEGRLKREDVVVVTKAGYVQGDNLTLAQSREKEGRPFPDMVKYNPDCWHCISPEFLADQITRSLDRLGIQKIDVLLLHNPEYFLKAGGAHGEYYERIRKAFTHLEQEADHGRISFYGISSNTFPEPREAADYTSLETVTEIAESFGVGHRFAVVQFPLNLYEPGAVLEPNNSGQTVAEYAREKNLGLLVNRPLNAFFGNEMVRLADFPDHAGVDFEKLVGEALEDTMQIESRYPADDLVPAKRIAWGHILRSNFKKLKELDGWKGILAWQIRPTLREAYTVLSDEPAYSGWVLEHQAASNRLFNAFTGHLEAVAAHEAQRISGKIREAAPALSDSPTLSRKVLRVYRSLPTLRDHGCILVGMRRPEYVRDALGVEAPIPEDQALAAMRALHDSRVGDGY